MLKININLMATNGGYYPLRKENIRGYFISVGTFTHDEKKLEKLSRKAYAHRRLRAILDK